MSDVKIVVVEPRLIRSADEAHRLAESLVRLRLRFLVEPREGVWIFLVEAPESEQPKPELKQTIFPGGDMPLN